MYLHLVMIVWEELMYFSTRFIGVMPHLFVSISLEYAPRRDKMLSEMLKRDIPWASPVVLVTKKMVPAVSVLIIVK